ncbi:hypothetical protein [Cecembia calidifontis]|jgi:hypothetical protein|uniref:Uncharacterized protein n=1 Tax=Cecembia calidifontis TaxID=1187080 RepID=A0A4Q7PBC0_9BACT|nr:hypothetical protein [Cecembia calidifontis]RZS97277.1 hypothetical protein BC751_2881 [Cecembia calidifontis]
MDENDPSIVDILYKNTGMRLEDWISMIKVLHLDKQDEIIKFLIESEGLNYKTAHFIAFKALRSHKRDQNKDN